MQQLFISDVHLGAFDSKTNRALEDELVRLIDFCDQNDIQLHVLGDLFDYWMEYPNFVPELGQKVLDRFEDYNRKSGRETIYITGNHDYWTISHFHKRGFSVQNEFHLLQAGGKKIFLCHGDGLANRRYELPRPVMHRLLRSQTFISLFQRIFPNEKGIRIMKSFSEFTRDEDQVEPERLSRWAARMLEKEPVDAVISGHDHLARVETFDEGVYINSGAFYRNKTLASYNNQRFALVVWDDGEQDLIPYHAEIKKRIADESER